MTEPITVTKISHTVQAMQYDGSRKCASAIVQWAGYGPAGYNGKRLWLRARPGHNARYVDRGDWVILGIHGEHYCVEGKHFDSYFRV